MLKALENARRYGYAYARICAMKSQLLPESFILSLLRVSSVKEVVEMLERTQYRDILVEFSEKYDGYKLVEIATTQSLARAIKKISNFFRGRDRYLYEVSLIKWHTTNMNLLIDARMRNLGWEEIKDLYMDINTIHPEEARKIVEGTIQEALKAFMTSPFVRKLFKEKVSPLFIEQAFLRSERDPRELIKIKQKLERTYYTLLLREVERHEELGALARVIKREIDVANVRITARARRHKGALNLIPKGMLKSNFFSKLREADDEAFFREVARTFRIPEPKDLLSMEIALQRYIARLKKRMFHNAYLTLGAAILFLHLKEENIHNLRKIAIGKEFRVPEEKIKEILVIL